MMRTPFFEDHRSAGARFMDFGGWEMPIQFQGILAEHRAVRTHAGLFDISHMGQIAVTGPDAESSLQMLVTADVHALPSGKGVYALLCRDDGGVVDDLYVYRLEAEQFLVIANASRAAADLAWLHEHAAGLNVLFLLQPEAAGLALQGPGAEAILRSVCPACSNLQRNGVASLSVLGSDAVVARTGYSGEDGFELFAPAANLAQAYPALLAEGASEGLVRCGLGARDTLRLEMGYRLYGNDLDESHTAIEAGLQWAVKFDKGAFIGRDALLREKEQGPRRRFIGFRLTESGVPRRGNPLYFGDVLIGEATSGTFSPSLQVGIGMGYVDAQAYPKGMEQQTGLRIEIHGRRAAAERAALPFFRHEGK